MTWTTLNFGKHMGKTLPQVALTDPDYFIWGYDEGVFEKSASLRQQAAEVYLKAQAIRVSLHGTEQLVVEYSVCLKTGKFAGVEVVPVSRPEHQGYTRTFRRPVFNLAVPRRIHKYDKSGCKQLVKALKFYVFGDPNCRLTKQLCEEFFENEGNFLLHQ